MMGKVLFVPGLFSVREPKVLGVTYEEIVFIVIHNRFTDLGTQRARMRLSIVR